MMLVYIQNTKRSRISESVNDLGFYIIDYRLYICQKNYWIQWSNIIYSTSAAKGVAAKVYKTQLNNVAAETTSFASHFVLPDGNYDNRCFVTKAE
jgi:hypothetical protein